MKVLITGISGFIGNYLCKKWIDEGIEVISTVRNRNDINLNCQIVYGDLSLGLNYFEPVDVIVHTAAQTPKEGITLDDYISSNICGTKKIIEYAQKYNVRKIIYISSISIYGDICEDVIDEDTSIINPNYYGLTKYIAECLLNESNLDCVSLRLPGILGEGANNIWLAKVVRKMINGEDVQFYNPNSLFNNMLHIRDLEKFLSKLIFSDFSGFEKLVLGCKETLRVEEVIFFLKKYLKSKSETISKKDNDKKSFSISVNRALRRGFSSMESRETLKIFCDELLKIQTDN